MADIHSTEKVKTTVGEREFVISKLYSARRDAVFTAFTKPKHVARWWGPFGFTIPVCRIDLRIGGVWHYCMRSPEGKEHWVRSIYREIVWPERIVYVSTFADEEANPIEGHPEQLTTVTFNEHQGQTMLTIRISYMSPDDLKATLEMGMLQGLAMTLNQLADYLAEK